MSPDWSGGLIMISTWLVQTSNIILIVQRGAIWARHGIEDLVRSVDVLGGFSKIARDLTVRF